MSIAGVVLAEWRDPEDLNPQRRSAKLVQGLRRYSVIDNLHTVNSREVTRDHVAAARRFTRDYEVGIAGAVSAGGTERTDCSSSDGISQQQVDACQRYRLAVAALGPRLAEPVIAVVLCNRSMGELAQALGMSRERAKGKLVGALDRLHDHYQPPDDARRPGASVGLLVVDPAIRDIPQTRLGRRPRNPESRSRVAEAARGAPPARSEPTRQAPTRPTRVRA